MMTWLLRSAERLVNPLNVSAAEVLEGVSGLFKDAVNHQWGPHDDLEIAALSGVAFRFDQSAMAMFNMSFAFLVKGTAPRCKPLQIPWKGSYLWALYCPVNPMDARLVITMTGFDGTLMSTFAESGKAALEAGLNTLVLMGPGID